VLRTFFVFNELPLTDYAAIAAGWSDYSGGYVCQPNLGIPFSAPGGLGPHSPVLVYYTSGGQIAGVGIMHYGDPLDSLLQFWEPFNGSYILHVSFRSGNQICSGKTYPEPIGTQAVINQDGVAWPVPLNVTAATAAQWTPGGCITKMGTHWIYDLVEHPNLSFKANNTIPLLPMFNGDTGLLSAFLVSTPVYQSVEPFGMWEGPFPPILWCKNFAPGYCTWDETFTTTMHFMLTNPDNNQCS